MRFIIKVLMRRLFHLIAFFVLFPYVLAVLYLFVPAPSTLMLKGWLTFENVERDWVPLSQVSRNAINAIVVSEDDAFCAHFGVDFRQMSKSFRKAQARGTAMKATSTITQQVAKNLFLWHGRSWIRKVLEIPLAFWLELIWPKARILEMYLNIAELGDGVYGVEAAAQHYYGTSARQLSVAQGALLATTLPNPAERSATRPGPAQIAMAGQVARRALRSAPDLACIR